MGGPGCIKLVKHLGFMRHSDWEPIVLTQGDNTFFAYDESLLAEVEDIKKYTFFSPDLGWLKSKLKGRGSKPAPEDRRWLAEKGKASLSQRIQRFLWRNFLIPDGKRGWVMPLVREAMRVIEIEKPELIYVRLPVWSLGIAARRIARKSGLPLIVDFDDEWTGDFNDFVEHPPFRKAIERRLEGRIVRSADIVLATTPGAKENFRHRYPDQPSEKFQHITMGYDPADFHDLEPKRGDVDKDTFLLTFLGTFHHKIEPVGFFITPIFIFEALSRIKELYPEVKIKLRIVGHLIETLQYLPEKYGISQMVEITGYLPHKEAMAQTLAGDALLLVMYSKGRGERHLPAKTFEYIAMKKPVLTLATEGADAWKVMKETGQGIRAHPERMEDIVEALLKLAKGEIDIQLHEDAIESYAQRSKTEELLAIFERAAK